MKEYDLQKFLEEKNMREKTKKQIKKEKEERKDFKTLIVTNHYLFNLLVDITIATATAVIKKLTNKEASKELEVDEGASERCSPSNGSDQSK